MGCHAEYKCFNEDDAIAIIPDQLSFDEAAGLSFGGSTALHFLRQAKIQKGEKVLINGASGGVGTAMVQLAKHLGAEVTGVCSTKNLELVRSLGAGRAIDYTAEDFTADGEVYDVIADVAGTAPLRRCARSLREDGRLLLVLAGLPELLSIPWAALTSRRRIVAGPGPERAEVLRELARLAAAGGFRPVAGRRFRLEDIVVAHRYVDTGHKRGNAVVCVRAAP